MENFFNALQQTLVNDSSNRSVTENGALGYRTTGKALLDMNWNISSLRYKDASVIEPYFKDALAEDFAYAIVYMFMLRDIRGGLGERHVFRVCLDYLAREFPATVVKIVPLISEYGRWDDLFGLIDCENREVRYAAIDELKRQFYEDVHNCLENKQISLLAKWLPSENASSLETRKYARILAVEFELTPRKYRKVLSKLRNYLNVVEIKMSSGEWGDIAYDKVPSRANLLYNNAFLKHDEDRRRKFLEKVKNGEAKINASALMPHEIVSKYHHGYAHLVVHPDPALEALWNALPNALENGKETIVVADGSGSMFSHPSAACSFMCIDVANALAIYFAERLPCGPFRNRYITFSSRPQLVDLSGCTSLLEKLRTAYKHDECSNTNIEKVFDLILNTAIENHVPQSEMPKNILILSDMEFDTATRNYGADSVNQTLFDTINAKYIANGYHLPRLVFWNLCSRTGTIPMKQNECGVSLISGFSQNNAKMVMSGELDPYKCLVDVLDGERYDAVRKAIL